MTASEFPRTIGIIGGMGPFSGATLLEGVFRAATELYGARANDAFPRVLLASVPVPSLADDDAREAVVVTRIREEIAHLEAAGASVLAIACLTVHAYIEELPVRGTWISLPTLAVDEVVARGMTRPLLLSSVTTARRKVLAAPLAARGIDPVVLDRAEEGRLATTIDDLVAGAAPTEVLPTLLKIIEAGAARGADGVVLGCTELSPFSRLLAPVRAVDPLTAAARALCRIARTGR